MKLHGNARTCPHSRLLMVRRVEEEGWRPMRAAEAAGVSVRTVSKWLACWRADGEQVLSDRSSAPGSIPHRTPERRVGMIVTLRRLGMTAASRSVRLPADHCPAAGWGAGRPATSGRGRIWRQEGPGVPCRQPKARPSVADRRVSRPAAPYLPSSRLGLRSDGGPNPRRTALAAADRGRRVHPAMPSDQGGPAHPGRRCALQPHRAVRRSRVSRAPGRGQ